MTVAGIDPGLKGAVCFYPNEILDLPICQDGRRTQQLDVAMFSRWLFEKSPQRVVIERQGPMPSDGVVPAFRLGLVYGQIRAACTVLGIPVSLVSPVTWKKFHGLPADKEVGRKRAIEQFPQLAHLLQLKGHHNRADACLIAAWGSFHLKGLEAGTV